MKSQVTLGDGKRHNVEGKGVVAVQTKDGTSKLIHDVLFVPSLAQNLLSVGQLAQKGYIVKFEGDHCLLIDKRTKQLMTKIKMTPNKVYPLKMASVENYASYSLKNECDKSLLWHLRFGHLHFNGLKLLERKEMVLGLPSIKDKEQTICEGCIFGKRHRLPFFKSSWRAKVPLELVHTNIWGPATVPSLAGRR